MTTPKVPERTEPQIIVTYHPDDRDSWQNEYANHVPVAGSFIYYAPHAYRVDEVWEVIEKHGSLEYGHHVFLRSVDIMETRLGQSDPGYYAPREG